jgi:hypothetical protein
MPKIEYVSKRFGAAADQDTWEASLDVEREHRRKLVAVSEQWDKLTKKL